MKLAPFVLIPVLVTAAIACQQSEVKSIERELGKLRSLPDSERGSATKEIALRIRKLPAGQGRVNLANGLANLSTEGDYGRDTLQEVATTLATALASEPEGGKPDSANLELAQLVRYEGVKVDLRTRAYALAVAQLDTIEAARHRANFTLNDVDGGSWTLSKLKGKVVLVNFWATWCPPCRKEMPDLLNLYHTYKSRGLVVLAISDEDAKVVKPFIAQHGFDFPVLLDPGRKVNDAYQIQGIPNSYIYDRKGRLVGEAEDMRTKEQFGRLLAKAGIK